ncbi:MAG: nucleoside recognition protein [Clostridia bacterium]|nr:nucleoside recognition protein [Clostridia bacterium]
MLNSIWPIFIIISIAFAIVTGNIDKINTSIFESTSTAVELSITMLGTMCLWSGVMEIASNTSIMDKILKMLRPILNKLFPKVKRDSKEYKEMCMNIVANLLGLGNAATPLGLKAMKTLQENNEDKKTLTDTMAMFIVLNTASLQIIPTTVISIRASLNSTDPTQIIVPVWIATISAAIVGVTAIKIFAKIEERKKL